MRKIFLSFLGRGMRDASTGQWDYQPAYYRIDGRGHSSKTRFVQIAETELLGPETFDIHMIVATKLSSERHFRDLQEGLLQLGVKNIEKIIIQEDMTPEGQWSWFEKITNSIQYRDELTVDLTHGYRSVPIVFSTAIHFLQRARNIILNAVYYGAFEMRDQNNVAPIIDMKNFYVVNEWAEAVSRLVEDADARKLASLAKTLPNFQSGGLNDNRLIDALNDLTDALRNVEVNWVARKAKKAIDLIKQQQNHSTDIGRLLLHLINEKFASLASDEPRIYDRKFFTIQLEIVRMLLDHKLFMQAYTVMRELIGSIGMIRIEKKNRLSSEGRSKRTRYSKVFVNMLQFEEDDWSFTDKEKKMVKYLEATYTELKSKGIIAELRSFTKKLVDYRNGFDHAWTGKDEANTDIEHTGWEFHKRLSTVIEKIF